MMASIRSQPDPASLSAASNVSTNEAEPRSMTASSSSALDGK